MTYAQCRDNHLSENPKEHLILKSSCYSTYLLHVPHIYENVFAKTTFICRRYLCTGSIRRNSAQIDNCTNIISCFKTSTVNVLDVKWMMLFSLCFPIVGYFIMLSLCFACFYLKQLDNIALICQVYIILKVHLVPLNHK